MPFKSKKQKRTIDAAAHNPAFAKKVGIDVSAAKKMSKHGKGQTKFEEDRTEVKDKDGKVTSWRDETPWRKAQNKNGRGKVTNLSDKARRETEKMNKTEESVAGPEKCWPGHRKVGTKPGTGKNAGKRVNDCEKIDEALLKEFEEHISEVTVTSGPNKGKQWSPKTPGPTNKNYKEIDKGVPSPPDGATAPPAGYRPPKGSLGGPKGDRTVGTPMKKAEVTTSDDTEMTAESSPKQVLKTLRAKHLQEKLHVLGKLILEAKKAKMKKKNDKVEEDPNEGNAFGKAVRDAKKDGVQKGEKIKVGGKEYPVKEAADKCNHTPKGKKCPVHGLKECGMYEGNDGNLANNAKPYDKVTRGDVIAGRLGKDEMGGKKKEDKKTDESYTVNGKKVSKAAYEKEMAKAGKGKKNESLANDEVANVSPADDAFKKRWGSYPPGSKNKNYPTSERKLKEGWTHDSLAAELFESGDEYVVSLHNRLAKQVKG